MGVASISVYRQEEKNREKFVGSYRRYIKDAEGDIYTRKETVRRKSRREGGGDQREAHAGLKTMIMLHF